MKPLNTAPHPPTNFVPRPEIFDRITAALLAGNQSQPVALTTAIQGGGGFGKTTLAQYLCHQAEIEAAFPDGILWLTLGQTPSLLELLNNQIRLFDPKTEYTDINAAAGRLQDLLAGKRLLLVLDDVWQERDATPFIPRSATFSLLITTRQQDMALRLDAQAVDVTEMTTGQGAELLVSRLAEPPADLAPFHHLAAHLGEWPLLLNLAAAQLHELVQLDHLPLAEALAELWAALDEEGFTAFDRADEGQRNRAISISLGLSLERLGDDQRRRFLELAVFPDDVDIPFAAIERLWPDLKSRQVRAALRAMQRLSLFIQYDGHGQTLRLHDVIRHYLLAQHDDLPGLHARLLNAYRPLLPVGDGAWADLPKDKPYLWDHLAYHLLEAGLADQLRATVTDLRYLVQKSLVRTPAAMEADLREAAAAFLDDDQIQPLNHNVTNAAHLLSRCPSLNDGLAVLHSRLNSIEALASLCTNLDPPYIQPVHPLPDLPHPALVRTLEGHTDEVNGCAVSPDGRRVVSASDDMTLKVWELETGRVVRTLEGHTDKVNGCAVSPDGRWIISASDDTTLKVWSFKSGQVVRTLEGHMDEVNGCAVSPDGRWIVSASADTTLKVWSFKSGQVVRTLEGHTDGVNGCAVSPDGRWIVSTSDDMTLKVWEIETGRAMRTLKGHTDWIKGCAVSPDGRWIISASDDSTLKVWELETGRIMRTLEGHMAWVLSCVVSTDSLWLISASWDTTLKVWELETGQVVRTLKGHTDWVRACAVSSDGRWIVSASNDMTLKVWELETERAVRTLEGHTIAVFGCTISPDGIWIVSASADMSLKMWEFETGRVVQTLERHTDWVRACAVSPDGRWIVSTSWDATLKVWELETGHLAHTLMGHAGMVTSCAVSSDGYWIVSASDDKTLKLWELETGRIVRTLKGHKDWVTACAVSPDGRWIVSASDDTTLKVWELETGRTVRTLNGHTSVVTGCAFSPDGHWIVSASADMSLKVWEFETGQTVQTLKRHTDWVTACAVSPDGRWIISTSWDKTLKVWALSTGQCLATLAVEGFLSDCAWHPDSQRLVVVGAGGVYFLRFVV